MKLRFKPRVSIQNCIVAVVSLGAISLLLYKLVALLPGFALTENNLPTVHAGLQTIWNQPLELPILLSRLVVAGVSPTTGIGFSRLPSVLLGILVILLAYWLMERWYNYRLALFGTILLMSAPWFLHVARLATNDIVYPLTMMVTLVLAALWHQKERPVWLLYVSAVAVGISLYVPGALWLLGLTAAFEWRNIATSLKSTRKHTALAAALGLVTLVPLLHAIYADWHILRPLAGLPAAMPGVLEVGKQFLLTWQHIFIGGLDRPLYNLAGLAMVDVLIGLMFVVGIYLYSQHPKAVRTRQLAGLWLLGTVLIALGGPVGIWLILPIVVILAMGGIGYLLHLWLKVFPRNPLARGFGIGIIGLMIAFAVAYNVRNYFVAWPANAATQAVFERRP